ncbi:elongation of very long chain fatty acids protein 7-like isoform X4 [Argiope bruennichi]|uniref:elongation of very long chain fatty acids protein 7-like isoform X4 n=1 Tax=Argiope bruennichi TaxID=94029 RepID=UPI002494DA62|nr:elongation of very long chain fatty acids protein 7-like isoform X4 [Argiope bruennichi]
MFIGIIRDLILFNPVGKFLYENVYHCYFILAAYVLFVMWLGPFWMRTRKPFDLKISMIAYNFFMSAFNLLLACQLYTRMTDNWHLKCLRGTPEYYQKFQIFFVLRKKQHQISFLHVFHHTSMCLFSISFMTIPDPGSISANIVIYGYIVWKRLREDGASTSSCCSFYRQHDCAIPQVLSKINQEI